jgi:3-phenylpropionate/trans-cinnamate dioxygenase ferredoxin reductase subunit
VTKPGVVIVGTGQAGFQTAASLRLNGYDEPVTLIGDEPHIPYQRPPLSKEFAAGKQEERRLFLRPASFYSANRIDLLPGETVTAVERPRRHVRLASGNSIPYGTLVLALGARVRKLPFPGVCYLRTLDDSIAIKDRLRTVEDVVIAGGGFIGLELAAVARSLGKSVTVVELQPRLMPRVVSPVISGFYQKLHTGNGVEVALGMGLSEVLPRRPAGLVIAGIGVLPNVELARDAGLAVGDGILVDEHLRTDDENIYAIGDCASHPNPFAGGRVRIESVQNAVDQAVCVAGTIAGRRKPYHDVPWFWTDQFDIKLQMAGLSNGYEHAVTRGNPESRKFSVFYFQADRLLAVDSVNRPGDHMAGRKLLANRVRVTPDQAADESVDLKSLTAH